MTLSPRNGVDLARVYGDFLGLRAFGATMSRRRVERVQDCRGYWRRQAPSHPRADRHGYVKEAILVLEETLGTRLPPGVIVHHINGDPSDNRPENLVGYKSDRAHLRNHPRKLSFEQAEEIRAAYRSGHGSQPVLGRLYGVSRSTIGSVVRNELHTALTDDDLVCYFGSARVRKAEQAKAGSTLEEEKP